MPTDHSALRLTYKQRLALKAADPVLFRDVSELFARHDLLGLIAMGAPADEYEPEVGTILPRMHDLHAREELTVDAARRAIHEEFIHWFSPGIAGPESRYDAVAAELADRIETR